MKHLTTICLVILLLLVACVTTGPGGKKSLILMSTDQEVQIGLGMSQEIAKSEKRLADESWQLYLNEVGQRIVKVSDRKDIEYHFTVIESDEMNAFATPGGYVYFYTGLLKSMANEGEMAAVMAHEISHVVARHGVKRVQTAMGAAVALELITGDSNSELMGAAINVGMGLLMAGYSRDAEREADKYGIIYMKAAGYDPNAAVTMFEKLAAAGDGGSSGVFESMTRSHPETQERIANARSEITLIGAGSGLTVNEKKYKEMKARLPK
jgi:predicted Zn-dependent protease